LIEIILLLQSSVVSVGPKHKDLGTLVKQVIPGVIPSELLMKTPVFDGVYQSAQ
jgi:hypothetical protein